MRYFFTTLFFLLSTFRLIGSDLPVISLTKVSPEGGVTYNSVMCIAEDEMGFIWFGSNDGLFRYNSIDFKRYNHFQNDTNSIPTNRINKLHKDLAGKLWIATENGLCFYNRAEDNFHTYYLKDQFGNSAGKNINSFFQATDSSYWFADERGFGTVNLQKKQAFYTTINNKNGIVHALSLDDQGTIWVFYRDGDIYYQTKDSDRFFYFSKGLAHSIRSVLIDKDKIWIAYVTEGLLCLNIDGTQHTYFHTEEEDPTAFPSNQVRSILKDENGLIWAATYKGIALIKDNQVISLINSENYSELTNQSVWSLYMDSQKNIWIGTFYGGICFHSKYSNYFNHHTQSGSGNSLSSNIVSSFVEVPETGEIIVATEDGKLNYFDPHTNTITRFQVSYDGIDLGNIKSLTFDKNGTLWIGTYNHGVLYKEKSSNYIKQLKLPFPTGIQALDVFADDDGLWVSNYTYGAYFYSFSTKDFLSFQHNPLDIQSISDNNVRQILKDKNGDMWFGTLNGLNLLKKGSNEFIHFFYEENNHSSLNSNIIYSMFEDEEGYLWLGMNGEGLNKFNPETGETEHYTSKDGLPGNEIFSILPDRSGNLWLTTYQGLCLFNPQTASVRSFNSCNGISNSRFNPNAALSSSKGELYFGGTNGFIRFHPENLTSNLIPPKTILTELYINNELVKPGDENSVLKDVVAKTEAIKLDYTQNSIGFRFVTNNYIEPMENRFQYRMIGFTNAWIQIEQNEGATFTNIPPGRYTFEVKASNNDGVWNEIPTTIAIRIFAPFWLRWYAYVIYILLIFLIVLFFRQQMIRQQRLKRDIEFERILQENKDHLHQMKLQFFTNISHEFRTPLTLIQGPVNSLLRRNDLHEDVLNYLTLIKSNKDRLLRLVNQFLDFRKVESEKLKLTPVNSDIISFCANIFSCFEENARQRGFNYKFISELSELKMDFDTDKLDKVLFNLLSNAFKYTPDDGEITFEICNNTKQQLKISGKSYSIGEELMDSFVEITISDTGNGIPEKHLSSIFERFYQVEDDSQHGTGIGLSLSKNYVMVHNGQMIVTSKPNEGTVFKIYLPQKQAGTLRQKINSDNTEPILSAKSSLTLSDSDKELLSKEKAVNQEALILIVEDNLELLNYLGDVMQNHFRVAKARNGKLGLEKIHSMFPDLVISDIMMPEMDGIQLCDTIKTDIRTSHIPVILLTALESVQDRISGIQSGADAYIGKPFDDKVLIAYVNSILESRKKLRESFSSKEIDWEDKYSSFDLDKKLLQKAISIVEENLSDVDLSVQTLASKLYISRTHLHRKLKSLTNQSASEFIRDVRLKNAVKLMQESKLKVNEIGYAVGFNSHTYFTRSFSKQYGMSPSEYMKEISHKK
ncbi:MAG: two-component regulator propeller domain-containing protein [Bacteroidales bacterium]|nr:two-component regulator propeller domain-containing protein [Bacteroidales bacterium]